MNWFDSGKEQILARIAEKAKTDLYTVEHIYCLLADNGLIDYEIEKEVFYDEVRNDSSRHDLFS